MSIQTEITRIENAKTAIINALVNKGVTVPEGAKIDDLVLLLDMINSGADVSVVTALASHVLAGKVIVGTDGQPIEGTMSNNGAGGGTISAKAGTVAIPEGYYDGSGSVAIDSTEKSKIIASNIKSGVSILGVTGNYKGSYTYITGSFSAGSSSLASDLKITNSAFKSTTSPLMWYIYASSYSRTTTYVYMAGGTAKKGHGFTASSKSLSVGSSLNYCPITVAAASGSLTFSVSGGAGMFDYQSTYSYYILI